MQLASLLLADRQVPASTAAAICASLAPVLDALMRGVDVKSVDFQAAKNAYNSWLESSWLDPRGDTPAGAESAVPSAMPTSAVASTSTTGGLLGPPSGPPPCLPRPPIRKPKPINGWSIEQYGLSGFSGLYAQGLHVPRVATIRQVMLWLLQSAPGMPTDGPLSFADLGAGTCAACVGARFALRDHVGGEHAFKVWH